MQRSGALEGRGVDLRKDLTTAGVCFPIAYLHHNGVSDSVLASSSYQQDDYLDKIFGKLPPSMKVLGCI